MLLSRSGLAHNPPHHFGLSGGLRGIWFGSKRLRRSKPYHGLIVWPPDLPVPAAWAVQGGPHEQMVKPDG